MSEASPGEGPDAGSDVNQARNADLVMEGGGVKGLAFAGALEVLVGAGYRFPRVAGTSAGAITGSIVAALERAGEPVSRVTDIARTIDLRKMRDSGRIGKVLGPLHSLADTASLVIQGGLYEGRYLHRWLTGVLGDLGVRTFGDLRRTDPGSALPPEREYSLVVVTSDISSHRMTLLPWDYPGYGLDPDEQPVADAVRASAAVPFFFEPSVLRSDTGRCSLVDGGVLSNYPITVFDQPDRAKSRWPTIGIRLSARETSRGVTRRVDGALAVAIALVQTAIQGIDARHIDDPLSISRTIFVDTSEVDVLDFDLGPRQQEDLITWGKEAAAKYLAAHREALDRYPSSA